MLPRPPSKFGTSSNKLPITNYRTGCPSGDPKSNLWPCWLSAAAAVVQCGFSFLKSSNRLRSPSTTDDPSPERSARPYLHFGLDSFPNKNMHLLRCVCILAKTRSTLKINFFPGVVRPELRSGWPGHFVLLLADEDDDSMVVFKCMWSTNGRKRY